MNTSIPIFRTLLIVLAGAGTVVTADLRADPRVDVGVSIGVPLPHGYLDVTVGREHYYTHRGTFYRRGPHGLMVVRAPRGAILRALPPHCARVYVGNVVYYRYGDVFYQPVPQGFVVVDAPPMPNLPPPQGEAYQSIWVGQSEYLFKDGQFFLKSPEGPVWTPAPVGAVTKVLPPDATSVWYQDIEYFESDGVCFRKAPEGYKVVPQPWTN